VKEEAAEMCDETTTLREIFKAFDKDGSGQIDLAELTEVMKAYYKAMDEPADTTKCRETAEMIMREVDVSGDGSISIDEFIKAFK